MNQVYNFFTAESLRLDEFLQKELPLKIQASCSNSKIRRLIAAGAVSVNGRIVNRPAFELRGKSKVVVEFDKEKFFYEKQPNDIKFECSDKDVLFEDENLIFINKPSMFPVEQTITGNRANLHDSVVDYLWKRNPALRNPPYVGIMHRLDRETSGVILFTKNRTINKAVSDMFQGHNFEKKYVAVVGKSSVVSRQSSEGKETGFEKNGEHFVGEKFSVEMFMGRISGKSQAGKWGQISEKQGGQYSKTDFQIVGEGKFEGKDYYIVECNLYTGRTHQIRVHLSSVGLPLLGDELYGGMPAKRIYLHAYELKCRSESLNFDVKAPVVW